jgi:hypothetical protein
VPAHATGRQPEVLLQKGEANCAQLKAELPKARYAHLATHGLFVQQTLRAEQERPRG